MTKQFSANFLLKTLPVAIATIGMSAHGAGLDRSGQDVSAFLQDGTYVEAVYAYLDADVSGTDAAGNYVPDGAEPYDFFRYGAKADINDTFSVGVLYDEPFGAAVQYEGANNFTNHNADVTARGLTQIVAAGLQNDPAIPDSVKQQIQGVANSVQSVAQVRAIAAQYAQSPNPLAQRVAGALTTVANTAETKVGGGTEVQIRTNNVTMLVGAKLGANKNFQIYGGPAAQRLNGEVHLRGLTYETATGYDARISSDTQVGWVAGVAYLRPEIALKAALTYRSEMEHETSIAEVLPAAPLRMMPVSASNDFSVTLPESWNLDFQTGINPTTLLTAKLRHVPWSDFEITPPHYQEGVRRRNPVAYPNGLPIASYAKDQWSGELGLARRLSDRVAVSGSIGYDSGAGNPVTTLGPIEGYYSLGLGARYDVTPQWSVSVGGKYFMFGDADVQIPTQVGTPDLSGQFKDNDGFAVAVRLAYQAK